MDKPDLHFLHAAELEGAVRELENSGQPSDFEKFCDRIAACFPPDLLAENQAIREHWATPALVRYAAAALRRYAEALRLKQNTVGKVPSSTRASLLARSLCAAGPPGRPKKRWTDEEKGACLAAFSQAYGERRDAGEPESVSQAAALRAAKAAYIGGRDLPAFERRNAIARVKQLLREHNYLD